MRRTAFLAVSVIVFGCSDQALLTEPRSGSGPAYVIADADRGYKAGFYWLPPMVATPMYSGTFDAELAPTVEICELAGSACGPVLATFTTASGPGAEIVRLNADDEHYAVGWHTNEFALSTTAFYRISVRAGDNVLLGYADVQPVSTGKDMKNVDTGEHIALVDGRTLMIKFRIETNIIGSVIVGPAEATASPGATQQFVATLTDLHGNPMSAPVMWASSDAGVATVDENGLATAVAGGEATITATSEQITGSAILTVVGGAVLAAGVSHTCALTPTGQAYCWGMNSGGELGDGTNTSRTVPVAVVGGLTFVSIDVGPAQSCGLTSQGIAYCWGHNFLGHLGDGTTVNRNVPVPVSGGLRFASMSVGYSTCGVTTAGQAYCWGHNSNGELGDGTFTTRTAPVLVSGGLTFSSISNGAGHTCAITNIGKAYCWGRGFLIGDGTSSLSSWRTAPVAVSGGLTFSSVSANDGHTCGLTTDGKAYCWGSNVNGQLGDGTTIQRSVPVQVAGGLTFASVTMGRAHACGLTVTGEAYCWGSNSFGELGDGTSGTYRTVPARTAVGLTFGSLSAGYFYTCGVTTDSQSYCWGSNRFGVLGNGTFDSSPVPVAVSLPPST